MHGLGFLSTSMYKIPMLDKVEEKYYWNYKHRKAIGLAWYCAFVFEHEKLLHLGL